MIKITEIKTAITRLLKKTEDIDVFFTSSEKITNSVYQNEFEVSYNNLTELHEHLNSGIGNNLFFDESIYHQLPEEETEELPF